MPTTFTIKKKRSIEREQNLKNLMIARATHVVLVVILQRGFGSQPHLDDASVMLSVRF